MNERAGKLVVLLAVAGAVTMLVAGWNAIGDPSPGALLAALAGLVALAGGVLLAARLYATVRYRIATPNAGLWLAAKIVGAVGIFVAIAVVADAIGVPPAPRRVLVVVLVAGLGWVVTDHGARSTVFQADATGVRFGRTAVPWPAIGRLVVAPGAWPGTAEIGAQPVPGGQLPPGRPIPGAVLAELPVYAVVDAAKLDWSRLTWAIAQFGRTDIELVTHAPAGGPQATPEQAPELTGPQPVLGPPAGYYPPPRTGRRRAWMVAGGIGLAVVLVAGVVTTTVLLDDGDSTAAPETTPGPRYSAASVDEACEVIDVYLLKRWSTVPQLRVEQDRFTTGAGEQLICRAGSESEYLVGRVVNLSLDVTVTDDAETAKTVYREAKESGSWSAHGDVTEDGEVPDLGQTAEYEAAIQQIGTSTTTTYVLTLRDDNLVLLLEFRSDSDGAEGPGVSVDTLARTAVEQATAATDTLRAKTSEHTPDPKPARLPANATEAAAAETTGPLMARVRATDACALLDHEFPRQFGSSVAEEPRQAQGFDECQLLASTSDPAAPRVRFRINLVVYLTAEERAELVADEIDGREVFHEEAIPGNNGCEYLLPHGSTGFGAKVLVRRFVEGRESGQQGPWPEACATAKEYATLIAPAVEKLPARTQPPAEPTLAGKDPCAVADALMSGLGDWEQGPISRYNSVSCRFDVTQGEESYAIDLTFDRNAEQVGGEPVTVDGLTGIRFPSESSCVLSLVYVPESGPDTEDAHNISTEVRRDASWQSAGSIDPCELATTAATLLIDHVQGR